MPQQDYIVLKASQRKTKGVKVDSHEKQFGKKTNAFTIADAGLAKEMEARYGMKGEVLPGEVVIAPFNRAPDPLHRRTFTVPDLPWLRKDKDGQRTDETNCGTAQPDEAPDRPGVATLADQHPEGADCPDGARD